MDSIKVFLLRNIFSKVFLFNLIYYFIALLLVFSALVKFYDSSDLFSVLNQLNLFPSHINILISASLPFFELMLGISLFANYKIKTSLFLITFLFLSFLLIAVYGFFIGIDSDCGCFGNAFHSYFDSFLILRNFILFSASLFILIDFSFYNYKRLA